MATTSRQMQAAESWSRTKSVKYRLKHTWSIEDFSIQPAKTAEKYFEMTSAPFSPPENDQLKFYIKLYPFGDREEHKDSVGIYLCLLKWKEKAVKVKYTLSILKTNGHEFSSRDGNTTFAELDSWGFPAFIKRDELYRKINESLPDDVLTIRCEADVIVVQSLESSQDTSHRMKQLTSECTKQLSQNWALLLSTGDLSDVILVVDGKEMYAHKLVLSAQSSVFKAMFEGDFMEKKAGKVTITDVDVEAFEEFLRFLYTGKVTWGDNALELMTLADKYDTESLKNLCEEYLASKLSLATVVPILVQADMHSAVDLKSKALDFIINNITSLLSIANWDAGLATRPKLYSEVFRQMALGSNPLQTYRKASKQVRYK